MRFRINGSLHSCVMSFLLEVTPPFSSLCDDLHSLLQDRSMQRLFDGGWLPVGCIDLVEPFGCLKYAAYVRDEKFMKIIESKSPLLCKGWCKIVKILPKPLTKVLSLSSCHLK